MYLLNKLTIKNLKLNKKRTIVTIIGIILSIALLTAVSSFYKIVYDYLYYPCSIEHAKVIHLFESLTIDGDKSSTIYSFFSPS